MSVSALLLLLSMAIGTAKLEDYSWFKLRRPFWVDCANHEDCFPDSCCTISYQRYTYPTCRTWGKEGETCRPSMPQASNVSLYYPSGADIFIEEAYLLICPCKDGLACSEVEGVCRPEAPASTARERPTFPGRTPR